MQPDQVQPGPSHQRSQALHELRRAHHQMRGVFALRRLEPDYHLPCADALHALIGRCRPRDVPAQLLQALALVGLAAHRRVQAETLMVGTIKAGKLEIAIAPGAGKLTRPGGGLLPIVADDLGSRMGRVMNSAFAIQAQLHM